MQPTNKCLLDAYPVPEPRAQRSGDISKEVSNRVQQRLAMADFLTGSSRTTWELIRNANSQPRLGPTESESLGTGPGIRPLPHALQGFDPGVQGCSGNHWPTVWLGTHEHLK